MSKRIKIFGMNIDALGMRESVRKVLDWCDEGPPTECRYVVTPNVDHVVLYQSNQLLRSAYTGASLVVADGAPVVLASRLLRKSLPERVAGSDLVPALFAQVASHEKYLESPLRVALVGAAPGVAERAARNIHARWSGVEVVATESPPLGFEQNDAENQRILDVVARAQPDLVLIGLGAPKQEIWTHQHAGQLQAKVALCVGATIDFLAGERARSPQWMQRCGLEWLHRLASEPSRLAKRYLRDAWLFPQLVWRDWRGTIEYPELQRGFQKTS